MAAGRAERIRAFLPFLGVGLGVVALLAGAVFWMQRGAHPELRGSIGKVRTLGLPDSSTIAVVDFRFANRADYPFVVRRVDLLVENADGRTLEGATVSEPDAQRLFAYYPVLGPKYNQTLVARTRVRPGESMDRMVAARFEMREEEFGRRKGVRIRVEEVDGAVSEIREERR